MIRLFGLYKNGKLAKISQHGTHLESDAFELTEDQQLLNLTPHIWTVREIPNDLEYPRIPKTNAELGLNGEGSPRITQETADAIGKAFDRVGLTGSDIDYTNDDEWKTRHIVDKINGES